MFNLHLNSGLHIARMYSLYGNRIDDAGGQALAEGLQQCTNFQELEWVICVLTWHRCGFYMY